MSGLSFVSNVPGSVSRPPALSGSSISSAPEDHQHHRQHSFGSFSFPNSDSQNIHNSSTPPSPSSHIANGTLSQQFLSKPPGLSGASLFSPKLERALRQSVLYPHHLYTHSLHLLQSRLMEPSVTKGLTRTGVAQMPTASIGAKIPMTVC